jgi:multiple sugar transport system ATP-binding protein
MSSVSLENIGKSFGRHTIINNLDLDIADGEFVVLVGPSGCGKSTLLRMIAGLEDITSGTLKIGDRVVNDLAPKERDIAMVFQSYALYPHFTVAENMGFSMRLAGTSKAKIKEHVEKAAKMLALDDLLDRYPRQLSGGQRQRVAMGRAVVRDPQVFLFDEPLSNLDAKLRVAMRTEIKTLHRQVGTTSVYVTHDQIEAMTMADRMVVMRGGHIEQVGAPMDIYDNPANLFVAGFIGSPAMNFCRATVRQDRDGVFGELSNGARLVLLPDHGRYAGRKVVLGLRPEHMTLGEAGIEATVAEIEPTGGEAYVFVEVGGEKLTLVSRERRKLGVGDRVKIAIEPRHCHLFDRQTEARIDS